MVLHRHHHTSSIRMSKSPTTYLTIYTPIIWSFDGSLCLTFRMIILPIKMGINTISSFYHTVDGNIDYNILLGHSWMHSMQCVSSTLNHYLKYIHEGSFHCIILMILDSTIFLLSLTIQHKIYLLFAFSLFIFLEMCLILFFPQYTLIFPCPHFFFIHLLIWHHILLSFYLDLYLLFLDLYLLYILLLV